MGNVTKLRVTVARLDNNAPRSDSPYPHITTIQIAAEQHSAGLFASRLMTYERSAWHMPEPVTGGQPEEPHVRDRGIPELAYKRSHVSRSFGHSPIDTGRRYLLCYHWSSKQNSWTLERWLTENIRRLTDPIVEAADPISPLDEQQQIVPKSTAACRSSRNSKPPSKPTSPDGDRLRQSTLERAFTRETGLFRHGTLS